MQNKMETESDSSSLRSKAVSADSNEDLIQISDEDQKDDEYTIMEDINAAFVILLNSFQYLKFSDLVRASCVSKLWNFVASHNVLWKSVEMNGKLHDFNAFAQKLKKHGTQSLDLRKMRFDCSNLEYLTSDPYWIELLQRIKDVRTLTKLNVGLCPLDMITLLAEALPQLKSVALTCYSVDFTHIRKLQNLLELELRFKRKGIIIRAVESLRELKNLKYLSLRRLFYIDEVVDYIPTGLESLVLGTSVILPSKFPTKILPRFENLKRLRLEKGPDGYTTTHILLAVSALHNLKQLELINFNVQEGFQNALAECTNLKTFLIIPYCWKIYDSFNAHQIIIDGVTQLKETLEKFILGFSLEFLDTVENVFNEQITKIRYIGEDVNVPFKMQECNCASGECTNSVHIDMISLSILENEMLPKYLPKTKVKILQMPFLETWEQTVT